jgi:hypothetical protein
MSGVIVMIDGLVKRYKSILMLGMLIVVISFFVGLFRLYNQATVGIGVTEEILKAYTEIIPLYGLGILKLGIGFAIVTIVMNLHATGVSARQSLAKIDKQPPEIPPPIFARIFARLLIVGILIETVAVIDWRDSTWSCNDRLEPEQTIDRPARQIG